MKRWQKVLIAIVFVVILVFVGIYLYLSNSLDQLVTMGVEDIDISTLKDGTYIGEYSVVPVSATVEVKILNSEINDIIILDHGNGQGKPAEVIIETVINEQSLEVDSISGATYSSRVIIKAIEEALKQAKLNGGI